MNIILQHFAGEPDELVSLSIKNIQEYADKCNAEYRLLDGHPVSPLLSPPCQKIHALHEEFDDYDTVVIMDTDMFTVKGMDKNVFDAQGIGIFPDRIKRLAFAKCLRKRKELSSEHHQFWGGSIYKFERETRQKLRKHFDIDEAKLFQEVNLVDEGIMHRLAVLADLKMNKDLVLDHKWSYCSYLDDLEKAYVIHIRNKVKLGVGKRPSEKRPKIENYHAIHEKGII